MRRFKGRGLVCLGLCWMGWGLLCLGWVPRGTGQAVPLFMRPAPGTTTTSCTLVTRLADLRKCLCTIVLDHGDPTHACMSSPACVLQGACPMHGFTYLLLQIALITPFLPHIAPTTRVKEPVHPQGHNQRQHPLGQAIPPAAARGTAAAAGCLPHLLLLPRLTCVAEASSCRPAASAAAPPLMP